ncbi:MAG: GNAT family N-acetyltransferase [Tidjanibacter sp.]|nr:GNAT family N-acetyltransferase [Tidjanibacter sp.]
MSNHEVTIKVLNDASEEVAARLDALMGHLTTSPRPRLTVERLRAIVASPHIRLFVAEQQGVIVGTLTAAHYTAPVGEKLWIEDVVVAPEARGCGIGRRLVAAAVEYGATHHPQATICLTSNPARTEARRLYTSLGFELYDTGFFRLKPTPK